jgi:hypothetical protein
MIVFAVTISRSVSFSDWAEVLFWNESLTLAEARSLNGPTPLESEETIFPALPWLSGEEQNRLCEEKIDYLISQWKDRGLSMYSARVVRIEATQENIRGWAWSEWIDEGELSPAALDAIRACGIDAEKMLRKFEEDYEFSLAFERDLIGEGF